jgi:hypothetical protein
VQSLAHHLSTSSFLHANKVFGANIEHYHQHPPACSLGLIWLAESTAGWFSVRKNTSGWLTDLADNLKRTGW